MTTKNATGDTLLRKSYDYVVDRERLKKNTPGIFIHRSPIPGLVTSAGYNIGVAFVDYDNFSNWCYLDNETIVSYDENGKNPMTTFSKYFYDNENHLQVTRTETSDSKGNEIFITTHYPDDVYNESSLGLPNLKASEKLVIDKLKGGDEDQHRIAEPIQKITVIKKWISS